MENNSIPPGRRKKRQWLLGNTEDMKIPRSTLHYRRHKKRRPLRQVSVNEMQGQHPAPNFVHPQHQEQFSDSEMDEFPINITSPSLPNDNQHVPQPSDEADEADEQEMGSDNEMIECPGMFSTSDRSTEDEVGPKEPVVRVKRRKLRRKIIVRERLDSDDALTSSSESCRSCSSPVRNTSSSPVPPPAPSPLPASILCATDDEYEILEEANETRQQRPSAPRKEFGEPLCPCTDTTTEEVMFMILTLGLRHGLTWVDILKMLSSIFKSASIPTTKHLFKERLNVKEETDIKYHVLCSECSVYMGEKPKKTKTKFCPTCKKTIKVTASTNCFVSLSVEAQLQKCLQDDYFVNSITTFRFSRPTGPNLYRDIYDGKVYKQFCENGGIISSPYNFSFTFFTDGVAFGKSSNKTIWPIYSTVNELSYHDRRKYFILAGVYAGPKDPNQLYFLKPFVDTMNNLSSHGVDWVHNGRNINSIAIPICCVVDSVARYQILNFKSFGGDYGCTFCYVQTHYVTKTGSRYPVTPNPAPLRNFEDYKADILAIHAKPNVVDRAHRGVKGYF
ncbi:Large tegument protein deneddylase [Frankliniella fusca]|uniref:Large tegument protein deneddylase n=1 Tax=Frankliniella fusca TaxID=407009 RepID=A0AAE1HAB9_9NEOP|nr:Large tegument protein deneddylase [Frankliniella fusca]